MTDILISSVDALIAKIEGQITVSPETWARWRADPFVWARERLSLDLRAWAEYSPAQYRERPWDGTPEPLYTAALSVAGGQSVAITSATGVGKTYLGAVIVLWFNDCWEGSQVITVAPKKDQLTLHIWKEIGRLWDRFALVRPDAVLDTLRIRMKPTRDDWGAVGFVAGVKADEDVAGKARGFHAEHMLWIIEETPGVHLAIQRAIKVTCTAPHNLRVYFGNPDSDQDPLAMASRESGVVAIRASALDHPNLVTGNGNLVPGAASQKAVDEWEHDFGGKEHPLWQSRARGIPPAQSKHALIFRAWLEAAAARAEERGASLSLGPGAMGVDVANSEDGDRASIALGKGRLCRSVESFRCPDANAFARHHVFPYISSETVDKNRCGIDTVGVGVGAFNELKLLLGGPVQGLNGGESQWEMADEERQELFGNLRCQMWWQARVDLSTTDPGKQLGIPNDPELFQDLTAPMWWTKNGKIIVESKEDFKKRLGRSPDKGDAFVYWNWVRQYSKNADFATGSTGPVAF